MTASTPTEPSATPNTPTRSSAGAPTRPTILPPIWDAAIRPAEFTANTTLNTCGETPNTSSSTNDAPAM